MTKIFISCPMRGLTAKQIETLRNLMFTPAALRVYNQSVDHEFMIINHIVEESDEPSQSRMWKLGRNIQLMDDADFFISPSYEWSTRHGYYECCVEEKCWRRFKLNHDDNKSRLGRFILKDEDMSMFIDIAKKGETENA